MKIRMDKQLKLEVETQVNVISASDDEIDRKELLFSVLRQFLSSNQAERYIRSDGKMGFRATKNLLDRIAEDQRELEMELGD